MTHLAVRHFDRDGDLRHWFCLVVVHRTKEKTNEKRSASAKGDRAIAAQAEIRKALYVLQMIAHQVKREENVVQVHQLPPKKPLGLTRCALRGTV